MSFTAKQMRTEQQRQARWAQDRTLARAVEEALWTVSDDEGDEDGAQDGTDH